MLEVIAVWVVFGLHSFFSTVLMPTLADLRYYVQQLGPFRFCLDPHDEVENEVVLRQGYPNMSRLCSRRGSASYGCRGTVGSL